MQRTRGAEDRRVVTVALASGGSAALDEIEGREQEYFGGLLGNLTVAEMEQLRSGLAALHRARQRVMPEELDMDRRMRP